MTNAKEMAPDRGRKSFLPDWIIRATLYSFPFALLISTTVFEGRSAYGYQLDEQVLREIKRFRRISIHEHYHARADIEPYLNAMHFANIESSVFFPTDWPPSSLRVRANVRELLSLAREYHAQIFAFGTAYDADPRAAELIQRELDQGAIGIKFVDWLSSPQSAVNVGPVDSANMYKVYEVARRYRVPVLLHVDFQNRPDWRDQFLHVASDFPDVTFVLAHYCRAASSDSPQLSLCSSVLDGHPNVLVDISMGGGIRRYMRYFDDDPIPWYNFILRYQDRLMWGTDLVLDPESKEDSEAILRRMSVDFLILQTLAFRDPLHPGDRRLHKGLNLPDRVLSKVYYENAHRLLAERLRPHSLEMSQKK
jgi:predicted TIM-barrel fold metal-dependent hydrolase